MAPRLDQQPSGSNMSIPPPPLYSTPSPHTGAKRLVNQPLWSRSSFIMSKGELSFSFLCFSSIYSGLRAHICFSFIYNHVLTFLPRKVPSPVSISQGHKKLFWGGNVSTKKQRYFLLEAFKRDARFKAGLMMVLLSSTCLYLSLCLSLVSSYSIWEKSLWRECGCQKKR